MSPVAAVSALAAFAAIDVGSSTLAPSDERAGSVTARSASTAHAAGAHVLRSEAVSARPDTVMRYVPCSAASPARPSVTVEEPCTWDAGVSARPTVTPEGAVTAYVADAMDSSCRSSLNERSIRTGESNCAEAGRGGAPSVAVGLCAPETPARAIPETSRRRSPEATPPASGSYERRGSQSVACAACRSVKACAAASRVGSAAAPSPTLAASPAATPVTATSSASPARPHCAGTVIPSTGAERFTRVSVGDSVRTDAIVGADVEASVATAPSVSRRLPAAASPGCVTVTVSRMSPVTAPCASVARPRR